MLCTLFIETGQRQTWICWTDLVCGPHRLNYLLIAGAQGNYSQVTYIDIFKNWNVIDSTQLPESKLQKNWIGTCYIAFTISPKTSAFS